MKKNSESVFNPQAVYQIPPEGLWLTDLVDAATDTRTGPIYVLPGTLVVYDAESVSEK
jgi:hypothetical protein